LVRIAARGTDGSLDLQDHFAMHFRFVRHQGPRGKALDVPKCMPEVLPLVGKSERTRPGRQKVTERGQGASFAPKLD